VKLSRPPTRKARIEIIPMIDTVFFLLVFFMMASLSMTVYRGMPVSLPRAASGSSAPSETVTITVTPAGEMYFEGRPVELDALPGLLRDRQAMAPTLAVVIHADEAVAHGRVVGVLDAARLAGVSRLAIATAPRGGPSRP
jgi:biopolymer transport protein ExbD